MKAKILYVEDEAFLAKIVKETFEHQGFDVKHVAHGAKVIQELEKYPADICILDVMLPGMDGFSLGKIIRKNYPKLPILFLSAKAFTEDVLAGFESGGNDYVRKPFSMEELLARVKNLLTLYAEKKFTQQDQQKSLQIANFTLDGVNLELKGSSGTIKISYREAQLLELLAQHQNQTIDRKYMLLTIWGDDSFFNSRNLDVYIRRIRTYFESNPGIELITLKGKGYFFKVNELMSG